MKWQKKMLYLKENVCDYKIMITVHRVHIFKRYVRITENVRYHML